MRPESRSNANNLPNPDDCLVKARVIAKIYDVDPSTVYKWAETKKIPCVEFEGIRRFHIPSVRARIEGPKPDD